MDAVSFLCPKCDEPLSLHSAAKDEEAIYFLADCPNCEVTWRYPFVQIVAALKPKNIVRQPQMVM